METWNQIGPNLGGEMWENGGVNGVNLGPPGKFWELGVGIPIWSFRVLRGIRFTCKKSMKSSSGESCWGLPFSKICISGEFRGIGPHLKGNGGEMG